MKEDNSYKRWTDMSLEIQHRAAADPNMHVLNGRGLLNQFEHRFTFVQNEPRGARSREVGRTKHSRIVCRPDGRYTATLRFDACEPQLLSAILAEVRRVVKYAIDDNEQQRITTTREAKK